MAVRENTDRRAEPRIEAPDSGSVAISGDLTFDTVNGLRHRSDEFLRDGSPVTLDLDGVTRADSAGLALMVEWLKQAQARDVPLRVVNMPDQMLAIARMSKLDNVLLAGD